MANNLKGYDANQVLRSVFDVDKNTLRVSIVEGSSGGGSFEVVISHINDSIRLGNGTDYFTSTYIGPKIGLDVGVINEVNIEDLDASKDNVAIHDADGDELKVNTDGSINVQPTVNTNASGLKVYNEVSAIVSGVETTVATHTALAGRRTFLQKVSASGDNIAKYKVKVNGITVDFRRTNFGSDLNADFFFDGELNPGLEVGIGAIITVTVLHTRGGVSDFNAKIQYLEIL
jgi:hypothetical protein